MNQAVMDKFERIKALLAEIDKDLQDYRESVSDDRPSSSQAETAAQIMHTARREVVEAAAAVWHIVDRCERSAGREAGAVEAVHVEIIIEPRSRDGYRETVELEIPAGLTGRAREDAIESAAADIVNEECPWGAQEVGAS